MKITNIETYVVGNPWKIWVFVRLMTDQGIYGVGEGSLGQMSNAVAGTIEDLKPFVIGADPFDVEWIVNTVSRDIYAEGGQIKMAPWRQLRSLAGTSLAKLPSCRCTS